jgi:hypothetical protein
MTSSPSISSLGQYSSSPEIEERLEKENWARLAYNTYGTGTRK